MSSLWEELVQTALLGTGRKPSAVISETDPASRLCAKLAEPENEQRLLSAIAIAATVRRAGFPGEALRPAMPEAAPDSLAPLGVRGSALLQRILKDCPSILPEFYTLCRATGRRIPEALLVETLLQAESSRGIRTLLFPVLGSRGQWLASLNPAWNFAAALPEAAGGTSDSETTAVWETGGGEQRLAAFRDFRRRHPGKARALAESTWDQEAAETRCDIVKALQEGLGDEDEAFLERGLDDRRKEVRNAAQALLVQLPGSALAGRMLERAVACLKLQRKPRGLLGKLVGSAESCTLEIELPAACDKAMERDGIAAKVPAGLKIGERGWWLRQILACISPARLAARLGTSLEQLEEAVREQAEWSKEIQEAWLEAARRCRDADTAFRLYRQHPGQAQSLLAVLRPEQREAILAEAITAAKASQVRDIVAQVIAAGPSLSLPVALALLDYLRRTVAEDAKGQLFPWLIPWESLALALPPGACAGALARWPADGGWDHWQKHLEKFFETVQLRTDIHQTLTP